MRPKQELMGTHLFGIRSDMVIATSSASSRLAAVVQMVASRWRGRSNDGSNNTASQQACTASLCRPQPSNAAAALLAYAARFGSNERALVYLLCEEV
jgi:hypothetical protein